MSPKREGKEKMEKVLQKNYIVPIQMTDLSVFDSHFFSMKERFTAEMTKIEEEMKRFSSVLKQFYGQSPAAMSMTQSDSRRPNSPPGPTDWETLTTSPLVEGEGEDKTMKLQFDVSQFIPEEITVKVLDGVLMVSAVHEENSDTIRVRREYHKELVLPRSVNIDSVVSSLSKDGILTIQAPLPQLEMADLKIN